jgi:FHA domain
MTSGASPFVGPRPYRIGERLFGRERERLELLDLLVAERIVLLYSTSGAGKTSLVQANCVLALREDAFTVPAVARVTFDAAAGPAGSPANRYVFAVLLSLEEARPEHEQLSVAELAHLSLPEYLDRRWDPAGEAGGLVLILDQFEEVLTIDPTDLDAKREFFTQLGLALRNRSRWALFSMREEHVAGLDPYRNLVPTRLAVTYRLELLNEHQARQAMKQVAAQADVDFTDSAARRLVDDLRRVRVERQGQPVDEQLGPTVEPTQLQVVCLRLWASLAEGKATIEESDIEALGSADTALADYYATVVGQLGDRERFVRDWLEEKLITVQGLRNQVLRQDALQAQQVDEQAIALLDERYLIREERRRGIRWLELAHDRLIEPVRANNARWRERNLTLFQRLAALWGRQGEAPHLEIRGAVLSEAERWAVAHAAQLTPVEQAFLTASRRSRRRRRNRAAIAGAFILLTVTAAGGGVAYQNWLDARPWARLTNLTTGQAHEARGVQVSIGRSAEGGFRSQINLEPKTVSRLHLIVSQDHMADDVRSLNGTTVNARFLRYSNQRQLRDGDVVTVAGMASFRYSTIEPWYNPLARPPAPVILALIERAWAIFIDGAKRTVTPLLDREYFLASNPTPAGLVLSNSASDQTLLRIRPLATGELEFETLRIDGTGRLVAMLKYEDRRYFAVEIPPGVRVTEHLKGISGAEYVSKMSFCFGRLVGEQERIGGMMTTVQEIESDEEPACKGGLFQIVQIRQPP